MKMFNVASSCLKGFNYCNESKVMCIKFISDSEYAYYDVPETLHSEFMNADSYGKFFNAYIKNRYNYIKIN